MPSSYTPISSDEQEIMTVGQGFGTSLLVGAGLSKTTATLSSRRLYIQGRGIGVSRQERISLVADLDQIGGVGTIYSGNLALLIIGVLALPALGFGLIFILLWFMTKERGMMIYLPGAQFACSLRGIPNDVADEFVRRTLYQRSVLQYSGA